MGYFDCLLARSFVDDLRVEHLCAGRVVKGGEDVFLEDVFRALFLICKEAAVGGLQGCKLVGSEFDILEVHVEQLHKGLDVSGSCGA